MTQPTNQSNQLIMIKKVNLLVMAVAVVFSTSFTANAQDDASAYAMWESIMLTPDNTKWLSFVQCESTILCLQIKQNTTWLSKISRKHFNEFYGVFEKVP